jgi:thiamine-phosphate pyrophosphorylase
MAPQLYLITPADADAARFPAQLMSVLDATEISALLVSRGAMDDAAYRQLATALINVGQGAGCAVLLENDATMARKLGADGVHITAGADATRAAIAALKPQMIVGAGGASSRHDAMTLGELDVDYLLFGSLHGAAKAGDRDLAEWWASTFEVPAVWSDPLALAGLDTGAEFVALSDALWAAPSPADALRHLAVTLAGAAA